MKKILIMVITTFFLGLCIILSYMLVDKSGTQQDLRREENRLREPTHDVHCSPPIYNSLDFNSVDELMDSITNRSINGIIETVEETRGDKGRFRGLISNLKNGSLYVPSYQGKEISYRNQEGFHNILLFPSELYDNPWVMYFPDKTQSGVERISIMYLSDETKSPHEDISNLISEIAPDAPNVHNYSEYPRFAEIYISELQLSDRKVTTLIQELKDDNRKNMFFVYDGLLTLVVASDEKVAYDWLSNFSFSKIGRN